MCSKENTISHSRRIYDGPAEIAGSEKYQVISIWHYLAATIIPVFLLAVTISIPIAKKFNDIEKTEDAIVGIESIRGLNRVIIAVQKIRGLWQIRLQGGEEVVSSKIKELQMDLDSAFTDPLGVQGSIRFEFQSQIISLRDELKKYNASIDESYHVSASFDKYSEYINRLMMLMKYVADRSGLTNDPERETHYLMEVLVERFPETAEAIGQLRGIASGLSSKGDAFTNSDYIVLQGYYVHLEKELNKLQRRYKLAIGIPEEKEEQQAFDLGVDEFVNASLVFSTATMKLFKAPEKSMDALKLFAEGTKLIELNTSLYNEAASQFNHHLEQRISSLRETIIYLILLVIFISLLVWYFIAGFYRSNRNAFLSLRASQERFSLSVRGTNDGIWDWDLESGMIYFSPRWKQMLGYELNDIDDSFIAWRDLVHPDDLGRFLVLWVEYMEGQSESLAIEYHIRRKTGDYAQILCRGLSTYDDAGRPIRLSGSQTDVTEYRQLQKQLQHAQKMEAIGQLTGGIAHDFNNMLASIMGYTDLAREELVQYENEDIDDYLNEVDKSSKRARDLVAQMLAFSRGSEDKLEPFILSPLINESLQMLGSILPSSIEIDLQINEDVPAVMTNPTQLHQLIMNLCINARDAMQGKGHITIGLQRVNNVNAECHSCHKRVRGDYIQLSVHDTGPGITTGQLKRIFDPFYTTKKLGAVKGTGMGLAMVHGIMQSHDGHVIVETGAEKGTTFSLLFPVIEAQPDVVNVSDSDTKISLNQVLDGNILIVDDEVSVGGFIGQLLKGCGCQVTVETDSQSALLKFKKDPEAFDLLVTDQTMPGMTGAELAQSLMVIRPELPVILCTGYSDHIDEDKARSLGIRGYVNKPIKTSEFLELVRGLLSAVKDRQ